jgi:UDP-glucose:(glucosyl)LPS alpha-1,2-glucosyltransferase
MNNDDIFAPIADVSKKSNGGTEMMRNKLCSLIPEDLKEHFQIWSSRYRPEQVDSKRIQLYWLHDLPGDPESEHLANGGYNKFERLVFVSHWQFQAYQQKYGIPWYKCIVLQNAIDPITPNKQDDDKIRLIYHTTPHRGLELLLSVFDALAKKHDNIELDVYSSFNAYGWGERDQPYEPLFEFARNHPKINYHGYQPNDVVRDALSKADIYAYPSIWLETSCISMMEAMSAGCEVVHPNYGALFETAANWTTMYPWVQDKRDHARLFYSVLDSAVSNFQQEGTQSRLASQKSYADVFYSWNLRQMQWEHFLKSLVVRN